MYRKFYTLLCGIVAFLMVATSSLAGNTTEVSTIEVTGRARIMAIPNVASLSIAVENTATTAQQAVSQNALQTETVIKTLKKMSEKNTKIKTSAYSLSPVYEKGDRAKPSGYRAINNIVLETKNLDKVGAFIDEATKAGANRIGIIAFSSDKEDELKDKAASEAVHQAIKSAENLSKTAGLTIKRIVGISYGPRRPIFKSLLTAGASSASTPIEAGQIAVEATVNVVFEVE